MLSKNKIKLIRSLAFKKYRDQTGLFVAEGMKLICDLATAFPCEILIYSTGLENECAAMQAAEKIPTDVAGLHQVSAQKSPQGILAVFRKNEPPEIEQESLNQKLCLALDNIQDPGNLGTIIRIADWFGIQHIFCSEYTADAWGPKTVQASMGALSRVRMHYVNLKKFLENVRNIPIYGTTLDGENLYTTKLKSEGIIVMGNEGNGISPEVTELISSKLKIPHYPMDAHTSESLNVAVAAGIVCAEFRRRG